MPQGNYNDSVKQWTNTRKVWESYPKPPTLIVMDDGALTNRGQVCAKFTDRQTAVDALTTAGFQTTDQKQFTPK